MPSSNKRKRRRLQLPQRRKRPHGLQLPRRRRRRRRRRPPPRSRAELPKRLPCSRRMKKPPSAARLAYRQPSERRAHLIARRRGRRSSHRNLPPNGVEDEPLGLRANLPHRASRREGNKVSWKKRSSLVYQQLPRPFLENINASFGLTASTLVV